MSPPTPARDMSRFLAKVGSTSDPSECWLWLGAQAAGYGSYHYHGRQIGAHVMAWKIMHGTFPPKGLELLHSCDVRNCVNPYHLSLGTRQDNMDDAKRKGRTHGLLGPQKTHCRRGHERASENLTKRGQCRKCANLLHASYKRRRRHASTLPQSAIFARALEVDERSVLDFDSSGPALTEPEDVSPDKETEA